MSFEFRARWYQKAFHQALVGDEHDRAIAVWHRRAGKDEVVLHGFRDLSIKRVGTYWHCLPEYAQARKALWTAINAHTGRRRIDEIFPPECRETTREPWVSHDFGKRPQETFFSQMLISCEAIASDGPPGRARGDEQRDGDDERCGDRQHGGLPGCPGRRVLSRFACEGKK